MELNKWLKRKFPNQSDWLIENYPKYQIQYLKDQKYNIGILKEDNGENKKGDFVIFKLHKEMIEGNMNGYEYPNEGGWSGGFEYYYHFAKQSKTYTNRGYLKLVDEITTKKETIKSALRRILSKKVYELALKNTHYKKLLKINTCKNDFDLLCYCFTWNDTVQGLDFWHNEWVKINNKVQ